MKRKLTVIRGDNTVYVDDEALNVDCSDLPAYVHAVQWNEQTGEGHIEFVQDGAGRHLPNFKIVERKAFDFLVERWHVAKAEAVAEAQERARAT